MSISYRRPGRLLAPVDVDFAAYDAIALCAGPGGFDEANRLLGSPLRILGVETDANACATAVAAGHDRVRMDMRQVTPAMLAEVKGLIITTPCPTFSTSGKGSGRVDYQAMLDGITCLGSIECGDDCEHWRAVDEEVSDARTALVTHAMHLLIRTHTLQWYVAEQVPALTLAWEDTLAELSAGDVDWDALDDPDAEFDGNAPHDFGWMGLQVEILDALEFGSIARRTRAYTWGSHNRPLPLLAAPTVDEIAAVPTLAQALGWRPGERVRTRGSRRPTGGNLFSADGPSWCLTGKARSWERERDGQRLSPAQAGFINGFPIDYPWQGSRTSQFQQIGDVVHPLVGAAVLGSALGMSAQDVREQLNVAGPMNRSAVMPSAV